MPDSDVEDLDAPQDEPTSLIPEVHQAHYDEFYTHTLTPEQFVQKVCSEVMVLPEKGVEPVAHMPCGVPDMRGEGTLGWRRSRPVMLILPAPNGYDTAFRRPLVESSPQNAFLRQQLEEAGIKLSEVIVTYAVRFPKPEGRAFKQQHKTVSAFYTKIDIEECQPSVIVAFGADALRVLFGTKAKLDNHRGSTFDYHGIPVVPTSSHLGFMSGYGDLDVFRSELARAAQIMSGANVGTTKDFTSIVVSTPDEVEALCQQALAEYDRFLAFDFEFGNDVARDEFNYPLTLQFTWCHDKVGLIKLRGDQGVVIHSEEDLARIRASVARLFNDPKVRLAGQHIRVDVDMMAKFGINIDHKIPTGFDTMLAHHARYGDSSQGLDHLCRKYTPQLGAFWYKLETWLDSNQRNTQLRFGYRTVPQDILVEYACYDPIVTWRAAIQLEAELAEQPTLLGYFRDIAMPAALHLLDVQRQGLLVDEERRVGLRQTYAPVYEAILKRVRDHLNWQEFNPGSKDHVAAALFSTTTYRDKKPAPEGANVLALQPLNNTDKYPKAWAEIEENGEQHLHAPSTKALAIESLYNIHKLPLLKWLKQLSVLGKFLTTYLADVGPNEFGVRTDGKGFANNIRSDGRVYTNLMQISETGRLKSSKTNLQTSPKKQEAALLEAMVDFKLGLEIGEYKRRTNSKKCPEAELIPFEQRIVIPSFKSCIIPAPGHILVEADFKTAEICIWAYCSGDPALIKILDQGRDMHSEVAATSFQLPEAQTLAVALRALDAGDPEPYKLWVSAFKKDREALRITAKACIFGIMYGRGANALSREMLRLGVDADRDRCQGIIDGIAKAFPKAWQWVKQNQANAIVNGYIETPFGNRRYFSGASELQDSEQAKIKREASNSPIQGAVAMLALRAGINLYNFRYNTAVGRDIGYKVLLPIHDAFLFEVPETKVEQFDKVVQICMSRKNTIPGTDGRYLGVDIEHYHRWGEH